MKIAVTGPESTGKTMLTEYLSGHYQCNYVVEYAREYLLGLKRKYNYEDVEYIAQKQLDTELAFEGDANKLFICDTDLLVIKVWMLYVFGHNSEWIDDYLRTKPYNLHLLCYPDIMWTYDPLRENPDSRNELFVIYKSILDNYSLPYKIIKGEGEARFESAINAIEKIINRII